jgi:pimeloyl-ACP methyl ester carboxylesterase
MTAASDTSAAADAPHFIEVGVPARRIATLATAAEGTTGPGLIWFPGLKSEMTSTKASAVAAWAHERGLPCTRFDYSGHGQSAGRFEDGTIGAWLEEGHAIFDRLTTGSQILVGSSTGGYIALLLLRDLLRTAPAKAHRIKALVLIAPAWDLTTKLMWDRFPNSAKTAITEQGVYLRPSNYGDGPYAITRQFLEEGGRHLIGPDGFDPGCPVLVLHGLQDEDVPWEHTLDLDAMLTGGHVRVHAVPEGDHRLSTPEDLDLLRRVLGDAAAS